MVGRAFFSEAWERLEQKTIQGLLVDETTRDPEILRLVTSRYAAVVIDSYINIVPEQTTVDINQ
jgi:hypothetical protein